MKVLYYEHYTAMRRTHLVRKCVEYIQNGFTALYILPSREAMFDVRRLFMEHMGGIFNCHVIGFDDLERMIVDEACSKKPVMDDTEKRVMLSGIMNGLSHDNFFSLAKNRPGFINQVMNAIRLLKRSYITPEQFFSKTSVCGGNLLKKCMSFYEIYSKYEGIKAKKGVMDVDDISFEAVAKCHRASIFNGVKVIVIDGFVNVDPVNMELVRRIMEHFPHIEVHVNVPYRNVHNEDFLLNGIIGDFVKLGFEIVGADSLQGASNAGSAFSPGDDMPQAQSSSLPFADLSNDEGDNIELLNLASQLYSAKPRLKMSEDSLLIRNSPCIDHELRIAAGSIKKMIQELKVRPDEIAVVVADMKSYLDKAVDVFEEYGIPLNVRYGGKISSMLLLKDVMAMLKYVLYQEERDDCFITMVTSMYLLPEELLNFEGFSNARLMEMAQDALQSNRDDPYSAFLALYFDSTQDEYAKSCMKDYVDDVITVMDELGKLAQQPELDSDGVDRFFGHLKGYFGALNLAGRISLLRQRNIIDTDMWFGNMKALTTAMDLLQRLEEIYSSYASLKEVRYSGHDVMRYIVESLSSLDADGIGNFSGGVKLISPDLMRGQRYYAVFVLGLNEGVFPSVNNAVKIFDGYEADWLFRLGINLMPASWELEREKIRFNACIAAARQKLYLSYRTLDEDGSVMNQSPFIDEVLSAIDEESREHVVKGRVTMRDRMAFSGQPLSLREAVKAIGTMLRNSGDTSDDLRAGICVPEILEHLKYPAYASCVEFSREFAPVFDSYDGKLSTPPELQQDMAYIVSVSRINEYAKCPFSYFAKAMFDVEAEDQDLMANMGISSFYHAVLKAYYKDDCDPLNPDADRFNWVFDQKLQDVNLSHIPSPLKGYAVEELKNTLFNFICHDAQNMRRYYAATGCKLKPALLEYPLRVGINTPNGMVVISGIVDRVDVEIDEQGNFTGRYIIYDYKKKDVKQLRDFIEGKDFQLPLYYAGVRDVIKRKTGMEDVHCMALLYYSIEELKWDGIISKDIKRALFESRKGPRDVPTYSNMEVILAWNLREALRMVEKMRKGHFMPPPVCPREIFGCAYRSMCRHNEVRLSRKVGVIND